MNTRASNIKTVAVVLSILFALGTVCMLLVTKSQAHLILALITPLLLLLPAAVERLFRCRICLSVYLFALFYALGPMLGESWKLYYTVPWWDKMLHTFGGVLFAIVGYYLFFLLTKHSDRYFAAAVFGLCFSMAVAVAWEFWEFFMDCFLGMDMQDDMVISRMCSYLLGSDIGVTGRIDNIASVLVNGVPLPVDGYIDIGLIDTMLDMLLESLGAAVTCVLLCRDRGKHPLLVCSSDLSVAEDVPIVL